MRQRENERFPDDLFRERLEGHQLPVGKEVWSRLDNQLRSRQKSFVQSWKFPAAASVTVVLLAAGIWISGKGHNEEIEHISSEVFESKSMQEQPHMVHTPVATQYTGGGESSNTNVNISQANERPQDSHELSLRVRSENTAEKADAGDKPARKNFPEKQGAAFSQRNDLESLTFSQNRATTTSPAEAVVHEPRVLVVHVAPAELAPEVEVENTVSVAVVSSEADPGVSLVDAKQKKRGGVQRLLRQLRNAKTGEKIEWEELGLNPQRSIANVEHSPEN